MQFLLETIKLGLKSLRLHLLRSVLTATGIVFGVAAVIAMVSIGEGKKQEALAQIERLGARNIILRSQKPPESAQQQGGQGRSFVSSFGITRADLAVIEDGATPGTLIVPAKEIGSQVLRDDKRMVSQSFGTTPSFAEVANLTVARGRYISDTDLDSYNVVCVLGHDVARRLFPFEDPIGDTIRVDDKAFTVVGVLAPVGLSGGAGAALIGRDLNLDVHVPLSTANAAFGDVVTRRESGSFQASEVQIAEIYVQSSDRERVLTDASLIRRIMDVRHPNLEDIQIIVPYELLANARKEMLTWNIVLTAIAGISLFVGGIGIMNIMLASVTERTREIGIRRAVGATRHDIIMQFLVETGVLSAIGGMLGVVLGVGGSLLVGWVVPMLPDAPLIGTYFSSDTALPVQVTGWSIGVAFCVATLTGLAFGLYPAMQASKQDPIVALRHD